MVVELVCENCFHEFNNRNRTRYKQRECVRCPACDHVQVVREQGYYDSIDIPTGILFTYLY